MNIARSVSLAAAGLLLTAQAEAASVETLATLARGRAALEALAEDSDGTLFLTSNFDYEIWRLGTRGEVRGRIRTGFATQVVVISPDHRTLVVTGHDRVPAAVLNLGATPAAGAVASKAPPPMNLLGLGTRVAVIDKASGQLLRSAYGPEDSFFNGLAHLAGSRYLIADSIGGSLWVFDAANGQLFRWLTDVSIESLQGKPNFGGANGLKIHGHHAYFTSRGSLWRVAIDAHGRPSGRPLQFAPHGGDDFDIARDGTVYLPDDNALLRISPDGRHIDRLVELGVGAPTAMLARDGRSLYLTTRGMRAADGGAAESRLLLVHLDAR
jgi:sugar lactone lactonase YvrE